MAESKTYSSKLLDINKKGRKKKPLEPLGRKAESLIKVVIKLWHKMWLRKFIREKLTSQIMKADNILRVWKH